MANGIYIAMCAAVARAEQLDSVADNLANAGTVGFKAARPAFEAFLAGASPVGYVAAISTGIDARPGVMTTTGNAMDLTPEGAAFLSVRTPSGAVAYSRDGRVSVDAEGRLRNPAGLLLDQTGEPVTLGSPAGPPSFAPSGALLVAGQEVARLGLYRIDGGLERLGGSLIGPAPGASVQAVETGVRVGELELANASALEATVALVSAQRHFDFAMQAIETYRKTGQGSNLGQVK